jgi:type IV pilus assembly protein PilE
VHRTRERGFTLIELMVVVTIVAVLASVALPSYSEHLLRARIADATTNLQSMRTAAERHYQNNRTYVGMPCTAVEATTLFSFSCGTPTATAYAITATGTLSMAGFRYSIDQANQRTTVAVPMGWSGASATCWVIRKGGTC